MLGIENLKKVIKLVLDLQKQGQVALADGKFTLLDIPGFLDELLQIPGLINSRETIVAEFNDLTKDEIDELNAYLKQEFDLENDVTEAKVEEYINIAVSLIKLFVKDKPEGEALGDPPVTTPGGDHPQDPPPNG